MTVYKVETKDANILWNRLEYVVSISQDITDSTKVILHRIDGSEDVIETIGRGYSLLIEEDQKRIIDK